MTLLFLLLGTNAPIVPSGKTSAALLRPAPIFSDHMVLPRNIPVPIFGTGVPGKTVEVQFGVFRSQTMVKPEGTWKLTLPARPAGGPFKMKIRSAGQVFTYNDVLVGDIWLASGQSNMEWPVSRCKERDELRQEVNSSIRLFRVTRSSVEAPATEARGTWFVGGSSAISNWSGIGTAFAIELNKRLKVPVGIVQATWGGTKIEAWTSLRALESDPKLQPLIDEYFAQLRGFSDKLADWQEKANAWDKANEKKDPGNAGFDLGWFKREFDDSSWQQVALPAPWEQEEQRELDGAVWYRYTFDLPEGWNGKSLRLELGLIGTDDQTYFNGLKVGATIGKDKVRKYLIGAGILRPTKNVIAVRVWNRSGEGGLLGPVLKIGPLDGSPYLDLANTWQTRNELAIEPPMEETQRRPVRPMGPGDRNSPAGAFNGMIQPLIPFGIKGVLWYQGEANVGSHDLYRSLFPALVSDWRSRWKRPDLPFFFVQLPGYGRTANPEKREWAELRSAQESALKLQNTEMVVTTDVSDHETIHPIQKREIGIRLANVALARVYGIANSAFTPYASNAKFTPTGVSIQFQNLYGGLRAFGDRNGFEILIDGQWKDAEPQLEYSYMVFRSEKPITGVRYNWSDAPMGTITNKVGLPLAPFQFIK